MLDPPEVIVRKFKRAVTDSGSEVRYDPEHQARRVQPAVDPGRGHGRHPRAGGRGLHAVRPAEGAAGEAVVEMLRPVQERYAELIADPGEVARLLAVGADKARVVAAKTLERAQDAVGFLPPG